MLVAPDSPTQLRAISPEIMLKQSFSFFKKNKRERASLMDSLKKVNNSSATYRNEQQANN